MNYYRIYEKDTEGWVPFQYYKSVKNFFNTEMDIREIRKDMNNSWILTKYNEETNGVHTERPWHIERVSAFEYYLNVFGITLLSTMVKEDKKEENSPEVDKEEE